MLSSANAQPPGGSDEDQCAVTRGSLHTGCGEVCSQVAPAEAGRRCAGWRQGDMHEGSADHQGQEAGVCRTGGGQKQAGVSLCGGLVSVYGVGGGGGICVDGGGGGGGGMCMCEGM